MASQIRHAKVLRIGIIQGSKIVQERVFKAGEPVWVGGSEKERTMLTKTRIKDSNHLLFRVSEDGYVLQFTDSMAGKISCGGAVLSLQKVAADPHTQSCDGVFCLPITQQDRGKINIDGTSVLFQFVALPPAHAIAPMPQMDFRPRLLEDDDPAFLGFLAIWSSLAFALMIWVWNSQPTDYTITDLPNRIAKLTVIPQEPLPVQVDPQLDPIPEVAVINRVVPEAPPEKVVPDEPVVKVDIARAEQKAKDKVLKDSTLLLKLLGTKGESHTQVDKLWSDYDVGVPDLQLALASVGGATTNAASEGPRKGGTSEAEAASIDDLVGVGGGWGSPVEGPALTVAGTVLPGQADIYVSEGSAGEVKQTIRKYAGQLNYCYEKRLKVLPDLSGRLDVEWEVVDGAVSGNPRIVSNTTGDDELATCVQQRIRRWRFEGFAGAANNPFIFQSK